MTRRSFSVLPSRCTYAGAFLLHVTAGSAVPALANELDPQGRIIGGQTTETCGFPSVVKLPLRGSMCTGTLVAPKLVFTAAHCLDISIPKEAVFGESKGQHSAKITTCKAHPDWKRLDMNDGVDLAYCVLEDEVTDIPITPILMGCETEVLVPGADVVLAGFGITKPPGKGGGGSGTKRFVETKLVKIVKGKVNDKAIVGSDGKQGCKGDSGGPVFVKLPSDKFGEQAGWRVFGVTSGHWGSGPNCQTGMGQYGMMHEWIDDVEKATGLDVTPCFDGDGTWNPGPNCHSAPRDLIGTAKGSWPDKCEPGPVTGKITTCGTQEGAEGSDEPDDSNKPDDSKSNKDSGGDKPEPDASPKSKDPQPSPSPSQGSDSPEPKSKQSPDPSSSQPQSPNPSSDAPQSDGDKDIETGEPKDGCSVHPSPEPLPGLSFATLLVVGGLVRRRTRKRHSLKCAVLPVERRATRSNASGMAFSDAKKVPNSILGVAK